MTRPLQLTSVLSGRGGPGREVRGLVFLAELGDKTQLATLRLAASGHSRLAVWIQRGAGAGFIIMGVLFLVDRG